MIRHLLRLAWRRRGANGLVVAQLAISFLVLALLGTAAWQLAMNWRRPLGFDWRDTWVATIRSSDATATGDRLLEAARAVPDVVIATTSSSVPYDSGEDSWQMDSPHGLIDAEFATVGDDALETWGLDVVDGRWFRDGDEALGFRPVVVDRDFARALRPDGDVVGQTIPRGGDGPEMRVIGVIDDFRRKGEASSRRPFFLLRARPGAPAAEAYLVLRMRPGTPASVEPDLLRALTAAVPGGQVTVRRLEDLRRSSLREVLVSLGAAGVVAGFLLSMVALGLVGVLWQNVARRAREIGLRRALGADPADVRRLVLGEAAIVAGTGVLAGLVVMVQVASFSLLPRTETPAYAAGIATAALVVGVMVIACSLPPAWQAQRVSPVDALRQE